MNFYKDCGEVKLTKDADGDKIYFLLTQNGFELRIIDCDNTEVTYFILKPEEIT